MIQVFTLHVRNPRQRPNFCSLPIITFVVKVQILSLLKDTKWLLLRVVLDMADVAHGDDLGN